MINVTVEGNGEQFNLSAKRLVEDTDRVVVDLAQGVPSPGSPAGRHRRHR